MLPKQIIHDLEEIDLQFKVADGHILPYSGYIETIIKLPFSEAAVSTLLLVVPTTEYNRTVPITVGTNIISRLKQAVPEDDSIPYAWELAFSSICSNQVGVARLTKKLTLQPIFRDITCLERKTNTVEAEITEPFEPSTGTKVGICPRIVSLENPGKTARVPVWILICQLIF